MIPLLKRIATKVRGHPVYHASDDQVPIDLSRMVEGMTSDYFHFSPRFKTNKQVEAVKHIGDVQYYDEGNWWAIVLIEIQFSNNTKWLSLLPIMKTIMSSAAPNHQTDIERKLRETPELIAFGIVTKSKIYGKRSWVAYDAFLDNEFSNLLLRLFWKDETFYSLESISAKGAQVIFTAEVSREEIEPKIDNQRTTSIDESGIVRIEYRSVHLFIPKIVGSNECVKHEIGKKEVGKIEYFDGQNLIPIGRLVKDA